MYSNKLINKSGINENEKELISKIKMIELFKNNQCENMDMLNLESLYFIHKYIFCDTCECSNKIIKAKKIKEKLDKVFKNHRLRNSIDKVIELYYEIIILNPFVEGSGISVRCWFDMLLLQEFKKIVNWSNISKKDYIKISQNINHLKVFIKNNLIDVEDITNNIFFKSIDKSYEYEGFNDYSSRMLSFNIKEVKKKIYAIIDKGMKKEDELAYIVEELLKYNEKFIICCENGKIVEEKENKINDKIDNILSKSNKFKDRNGREIKKNIKPFYKCIDTNNVVINHYGNYFNDEVILVDSNILSYIRDYKGYWMGNQNLDTVSIIC